MAPPPPSPRSPLRRWRWVIAITGGWIALTTLLALGDAVGLWSHLGSGAILVLAGLALGRKREWDGLVAVVAGGLLIAVGLCWPRHAGAPAVWVNVTAGLVPVMAVVTASLAGGVPWVGPPEPRT